MTKFREVVEKYQLYAKKYECKKSVKILTLDDRKVVVKEKNKNKRDLFSYLDSKDFRYALKPINVDSDDSYEIYPYVSSKVKEKEEKAVDMMYILSLLHNKTSFYKEVNLDDVKAIYEGMLGQIEYLYYYYHDLQDMLEKKVYMAPDEYLLMRNMTMVYLSLEYAKNKIDQWYEKVKNKKSIRHVLLHYKVETSHFIEGEQAYFISWDHARRDIPIYDFLNFFRSEYLDLDMNSLFNIYKHKYPFTSEERDLFFTFLALPPKLVMKDNSYNKYCDVYRFVTYLNKSYDFLSKQDEGYQKSDE